MLIPKIIIRLGIFSFYHRSDLQIGNNEEEQRVRYQTFVNPNWSTQNSKRDRIQVEVDHIFLTK